MSSAYGIIPKPVSNISLDTILPISKTLRNGTKATLQQVDPNNQALVSVLRHLVNYEINMGSTYPQEHELDEEGFTSYFLAYDSFVLVKDDPIVPGKEYDMHDKVLGCFYVKPNYPGRCSHIANGGFFVSTVHRGFGAGIAMGESFPQIASALGYQASVFNLVFQNNEASIKIWRRLGFKEAGRIPKAGRLENSPGKLVDAIIFYKDFTEQNEETDVDK
ncbi:uncharacterized protein BX664DRAFT_343882 [Halteromyces radiatus]|uniref:uncharacterized protein n=1 Tax=Halteromyces radiatus TaxID=101107 RepID=UPI00221FD706|nr:uncharacterized protein BX664DRAFT_343882 [Halteromyces radiatus]KAI8076769.1 hypothetical protein BX664DRAFT_343882 [Halteromyces radiatus]